MMNYHYNKETNLFQVFYGDVLLVALEQTDKMNDQEAEELAHQLYNEYIDSLYGSFVDDTYDEYGVNTKNSFNTI